MRDLLQAYLHYCRREKALAATTLDSYDESARGWLDWFAADAGREAGIDDWCDCNARAYHSHEKLRGIRQSTIRGRVAALRAWGNWLVANSHVPDNPWLHIRTPVNEDQHQPCPTADQVRALLDACDRMPNKRRGAMTKAAIALMAFGAMRVSEMVMACLDDLKLAGKPRYIELVGKGAKAGKAILNNEACTILQAWLIVRPETQISNLFFLRGAQRGDRPYSESAFNDAVAVLKSIAGIRDADVPPHSLRRFSGTMVAQQKGGSVADAQKHLRHSHIQTTLRYIKCTNNLDNLVEGILEAPPIPSPLPPPPVAPPPDRQVASDASDNRTRPAATKGKRGPAWRKA